MRPPKSSRKQTLLLLSLTLGGIIVSGFIAVGPLSGAEDLWRNAIRVVRGVFGLSESVTQGPTAPGDATTKELRTVRSGQFTGGLQDGQGTSPGEAILADGAGSGGDTGGGSGEGSGEQPSSGRHSPTPEISALPTETPTVVPEESPTPAEPSETPTLAGTPTPSPTPTSTVKGRRLMLSSVEVAPGENFQVDLACDDLMGVAGCDAEIAFPASLIDLVTVHKTDLSDPFLLVKRKGDGDFAVSLAAVEGILGGEGVLLTFEGVASASPSENTASPLQFSRAKMYDEQSRQIPVQTQDGLVTIAVQAQDETSQPDGGESEEPQATLPLPTPLVQPTSSPDSDPEGEPTADSGQPVNPDEGLPSDPVIPPAVPEDPYGGSVPASPVPTSTPIPPAESAAEETLQTDLTGDGFVNYEDLFEFIRYWKQSKSGK